MYHWVIFSTLLCVLQPGWPNTYPETKGWKFDSSSQCESCPEGSNRNCGQHRQSPIDLHRDRAIPGNPNEKECPDWHWYVNLVWRVVQTTFCLSLSISPIFFRCSQDECLGWIL
jgi:hypothetical protein